MPRGRVFWPSVYLLSVHFYVVCILFVLQFYKSTNAVKSVNSGAYSCLETLSSLLAVANCERRLKLLV